MRKVYICFSSPKKWKPFAELIKFADNTAYSHVYFEFHTNTLQYPLIYQASHTMVNFMGYEIFYSHNKMIKKYELEISDENYHRLMQFCVNNAGKPYPILQVVGIGIQKLLKCVGIKNSHNIFRNKDEQMVCSELADIILNNFWFFGTKKDQDLVDPLDIDLILATNPDKCQLINLPQS